MHISPAILFQEITTAILNHSARAFGISSLIKAQELLPTLLPLSQSILVIWPRLVGLIALMLICFTIRKFVPTNFLPI